MASSSHDRVHRRLGCGLPHKFRYDHAKMETPDYMGFFRFSSCSLSMTRVFRNASQGASDEIVRSGPEKVSTLFVEPPRLDSFEDGEAVCR